jgi:hypothetical protein
MCCISSASVSLNTCRGDFDYIIILRMTSRTFCHLSLTLKEEVHYGKFYLRIGALVLALVSIGYLHRILMMRGRKAETQGRDEDDIYQS